jgi:hypothetical protein
VYAGGFFIAERVGKNPYLLHSKLTAMKFILWGLLLLLSCPTFSQTSGDDVVTDISGASGNPFLLKDWSDGVVVFSSGRVVKQFKLRFDCVRNRLMLQFEGTSFAAESQVKAFTIYTKSGKNKDSLCFRKGFPAVDGQTEETFYQVLLDKKATLLCLFSKTVLVDKQVVQQGNNRRLEDKESYYLLQDGKMTLLPKNKNELAELLPAHADTMKQFVGQQSFRMDKPEDYVKIIGRYNELLQ